MDLKLKTKIMKLKIEHLAPYLPYKLKCKTEYGWTTMESLSEFEINESHEDSYSYEQEQEFKPILRPLSDLTIEDDEWLEDIYSNSWMACGYIVKARTTFIEIISKEDNSIVTISVGKPQCNEYWINEILFSHHFDVFGLIEKDLAVDINTLKL